MQQGTGKDNRPPLLANHPIEIPEEPEARNMLLYAGRLFIFWIDTHAKETAVLVIEDCLLADIWSQKALARLYSRRAEEAQHNVTTCDRVEMKISIVGRASCKPRSGFTNG